MYYSEQALKDLAVDYSKIPLKTNNLIEKFVLLKTSNPRAREFASQGFARRAKVMARCIRNVFEEIPPDSSDIPSRDQLSDATISIQSFVFNVFGAVDNLAWIWMMEHGQKRGDATPIPDAHVGLGPGNISVRATLSNDLQTYLTSLNKWFEHIASLRHALAHRIPLYIPPYVIQTKDEAKYNDFETKMDAAVRAGNFVEYDRLSSEQLQLGRFRPWVQHSIEEKSKPVVFHAQMLADFNTVEELANKMLIEIAKPRT